MTIVTKDRGSYVQEKPFCEKRFNEYFWEIVNDSGYEYNKEVLEDIRFQAVEFITGFDTVKAEKLGEYILRYLDEKVDEKNPDLKWVGSSFVRRQLYKNAGKLRGFDYKKGYGNLYQLIKYGVECGFYDETLLFEYTQEEIETIGKMIVPERDKYIDYAGIELLADKYLQKNYADQIIELPQERYMISAMYLMSVEKKEDRLEHIEWAYECLSEQLFGLATPTAMNSGRSSGSLSSCHVLTASDDLINIFDTNTNIARFSQNGAGIGIFLGFLRGIGSWIRGFKGRASGITHPSRLLSVIAEYVNQLGNRPAGIAIYLPLHHIDIFQFLELRLKTGTQEKRAHSIKTAVCVNDEFMRRLKDGGSWTLFDPLEFEKLMGVNINNLYDKKRLRDGETPNEIDHAFTYYYRLAEENPHFQLAKKVLAKDVYRGIYSSRKTGGTPYLFFHDTANRMNPNKHAGMIYSSNLCNEIYQNMSPDQRVAEFFDEEDEDLLITYTKSGDLVTCNLSSINWSKVLSPKWKGKFYKIIKMQVRMADNVITLDRSVVQQARRTNRKYRAIGIGDMGTVEYMAMNGIPWESNQATEFYREIFKMKLKAVIQASHELALEKGTYKVFEGSDWHNGDFFDIRGFYGDEWIPYREMAHKGMRNAYLLATAPTSANAVMLSTTPAIDPLYDYKYKEKKSGIEVLRIVSNYNDKTKWLYKSGFKMDEMWAINHIAGAQEFVDQGISHNMHVNSDISGKEMLRLDHGAWDKGLKGIYYTYTSKLEKPEDCVLCEG